MANRHEKAIARPFSTRFLPDAGIPEYNALLDHQLGKRREFLLTNAQSLTLMHETGVIDRVEATSEHRYVVFMAKKPTARRQRPPFRPAAGSTQRSESQTLPWRQYTHGARQLSNNQRPVQPGHAVNANECVRTNIVATDGSPTVPLTHVRQAGTKRKTLPAEEPKTLIGSMKGRKLLAARGLMYQQCTVPTDSIRLSDAEVSDAYTKSRASTTGKTTVEHLLESDAAFMTQIHAMNEQLNDLRGTKTLLERDIRHLRRQVRGVNAVRENDVAVAHCSSIMQHRISKAEEEFMVLVTQQQHVKESVDRLRLELLSLRRVRQKLQDDCKWVAQANQVYDEKIQASKSVCTQLSEELRGLERRAEAALETQRLTLPPDDVVVVDVAQLMSAVKERTKGQRPRKHGVLSQPTAARPSAVSTATKSLNDRHNLLLDYTSAFRVLQTTLGVPDLQTFQVQFTTLEEQLHAKFKANLALGDQVAMLERKVSAQILETVTNQANARNVLYASETNARDMQTRVDKTVVRIEWYNQLRHQRNQELLTLHDVMVRALGALLVDVQGARHGTNTLQASPIKLLEMLQCHLMHLALALEAKYRTQQVGWRNDGRCNSVFATRGPKVPSGSAWAAILSTVQPPSVESAAAWMENMSLSEVMHGLHRTGCPARRKAQSFGKLDGKTREIGSYRLFATTKEGEDKSDGHRCKSEE